MTGHWQGCVVQSPQLSRGNRQASFSRKDASAREARWANAGRSAASPLTATAALRFAPCRFPGPPPVAPQGRSVAVEGLALRACTLRFPFSVLRSGASRPLCLRGKQSCPEAIGTAKTQGEARTASGSIGRSAASPLTATAALRFAPCRFLGNSIRRALAARSVLCSLFSGRRWRPPVFRGWPSAAPFVVQ